MHPPVFAPRRAASAAVRSLNQSTRRSLRRAAAEALESRTFLSVSDTGFAKALQTPGTTWTYEATPVSGSGASSQTVETVKGNTTLNGHSAIEIDYFTTSTSNGITATGSTQGFETVTSAGIIAYGGTLMGSTGFSSSTMDSPYQLGFPALLAVGSPVSAAYTETSVQSLNGINPATTTSTVTNKFELISDTQQSITVPKGTFSCYEIHVTTSRVTPAQNGAVASTSTDITQDFYAPEVGIVKSTSLTSSNPQVSELSDFQTSPDSLAFQQQPTDAESGQIIKPVITVAIKDENGATITTGDDSTDSVTLKLTGTGTGTLSGTTTVRAVNGVAQFSNLSVTGFGSLTLTATSDQPLASDISSPFTISVGLPATLTPILSRLNVPTTAVGGGKISVTAPLTLSNNTDSTITGNAKVATFLSTSPSVNAAAIRLSPAEASAIQFAPADGASLQVGKTLTQHVSLKAHKSAHITVHITSLPQVPAAGNYYLVFQITDPAGNVATVSSSKTIAVGPPVIALTETIAALKIPSTIANGQKLKAASIKLIVKNSGNVIAKGKTSFSVSASAVSGSVGTPITSYSTVLNTAPNKTKPVSINIKSLPTLAAGSYFIVIQAKDSLGGTSIVSSASPITISA